jgi:hypothetical protein
MVFCQINMNYIEKWHFKFVIVDILYILAE